MKRLIKKIKGGFLKDKRGSISFANGFKMSGYKRFYIINLPKKKMIRAFHGHLKEKKAVFPISGSILLSVVDFNKTLDPLKKDKVQKFVLDSRTPYLFEIPSKSANGVMSLEKDSTIIFFSNKTVKQSEKDDYRIAYDYWGKEIWKVE